MTKTALANWAMVGVMLDALELRQARHGCLAICGAAGLASATVVERVDGF